VTRARRLALCSAYLGREITTLNEMMPRELHDAATAIERGELLLQQADERLGQMCIEVAV
jgi:hypothetical protein